MMKVTLDRLPPEERARIFDTMHKDIPGLDAGNDRYTRELHKFRAKWAAQEAAALREAEAEACKQRRRQKAREARRAAVPRPAAKLPQLSGDPRDMIHALEPYARGELGLLVPSDCVQALVRLRSVLAQDSSPVAVRRAGERVTRDLLRNLADAATTCPDLQTIVPALPIAVDALWHKHAYTVASNIQAGLSLAPPLQGESADSAMVALVVATLQRVAKLNALGKTSPDQMQHIARAVALGALASRQTTPPVSSTLHRNSVERGGPDAEQAALKVLAPAALRMPTGSLSLATIEALLLLCSLPVLVGPQHRGRDGVCGRDTAGEDDIQGGGRDWALIRRLVDQTDKQLHLSLASARGASCAGLADVSSWAADDRAAAAPGVTDCLRSCLSILTSVWALVTQSPARPSCRSCRNSDAGPSGCEAELRQGLVSPTCGTSDAIAVRKLLASVTNLVASLSSGSSKACTGILPCSLTNHERRVRHRDSDGDMAQQSQQGGAAGDATASWRDRMASGEGRCDEQVVEYDSDEWQRLGARLLSAVRSLPVACRLGASQHGLEHDCRHR